MTKRLSLKAEALTELTTAELGAVAGAAADAAPTTPLKDCLGLSYEFTCVHCTRGAVTERVRS